MEQERLLINPSKIYEPESVSRFGDEYRNEYGAIRRIKVRTPYFKSIIFKSDVVDLYKEWRDDAEYFILKAIIDNNTQQMNIIPFKNYSVKYGFDNWFQDPELVPLYRLVKASKRGNDVYKHLVSKKLEPLRTLQDINFFNNEWSVKNTNMLFITLTYDTKRCDSDTAWYNIGSEFHLFCNNLRKHYNSKIEFFRAWESTKNYYPHIHLILCFKSKTFPAFEHKDKDGKISYRISYNEVKKISGYWHSNIDVQAVDSSQKAIMELTKYITKDLCSEKGDKTNSMIWLHNKQGYAVTRGFVGMIDNQFADMDVSEPKTTDLINDMSNCNHDVFKWEFVGVLRGHQLGINSEIWCVDLKKPPPKIAELLYYENLRWRSLHSGRF